MIIIFILIFVFVLVGFIYYTAKSYKSVFELTHPAKYKYDLRLKIPYTYKKFEFMTRDGIKLAGIDYQPKTACIGIILVCHFLGGSKEAILMFIDSLLMNGYRVLSFDNRNHGESETYKGVKISLQTDFSVFYEKIKSMKVEGPFGIMGFSMGASQALWAINKYSDIQAAITDGGPLLYVKKYFNYVLDDKKIQNPIRRSVFLFIFLHYVGFARMAKKLKGKPVLLIHGEKDNIITIDNPKLAYELLKSSEASIWCVPRSRHLTNKHLKPKEYDERIVEFFNKNIANK
jgi:alpha-beta hydrolase superfamily lysophospholipase